ncbi:hypothetical protein Tco_1410040 [Tanacetum coccineum]
MRLTNRKTIQHLTKKSLRKILRRILRKNQKKKSQKRLNRWTLISVFRTRMRKRMRQSSSALMRLRGHLTLHLLYTLMRIGKERAERDLREMMDWAHGFYEGILMIKAVGGRPCEAIDMLAIFGEIMLPKMMKRKAVKKMVKMRITKAIAEYEKTRANPDNARGSGLVNAGGIDAPKVHEFGLKRWFKKMEQVFEISKCAKEDKVKFVACTFEGRSLTWWNGNVQTLGLANANQIP